MNSIFKEMQDLLNDLRNRINKNKCGKCGQEIQWSDRQYKKNCPKCGSVLIRSSALPQNQIKCWLCLDTGIVTYSAQQDDFTYEFGAACTCELGKSFVSEKIFSITDCLFAPPLWAIERQNKELCKENK